MSKTGLYRDPSNETIGRIFVRDGKLMASESPGEDNAIELTPVDANRFVVAGTPIEVEFVPPEAGRAQQLRVVGAGPKPAAMDQVVLTFAPSTAELGAFAGSYANPDLDVTYTIAARDADLVIRMPARPDAVLKPIVADTFHGPLVEIVKFSRDARGAVTGFTVHTSGVRGLRFDRTVSSVLPSARVDRINAGTVPVRGAGRARSMQPR